MCHDGRECRRTEAKVAVQAEEHRSLEMTVVWVGEHSCILQRSCFCISGTFESNGPERRLRKDHKTRSQECLGQHHMGDVMRGGWRMSHRG